ncbi:hypothetical protein FRC04_006281 [Tulasnella sp. 424]|nr:hypothetical protein FRC04_006281 [Tulasnella sp. 424]KAG8980335.1 hypothetical protein FRC05_005965 [Tulasnella sp. 425]
MFSGTAWGSFFAVSASWVVDWLGVQDRRASELGDDGDPEKPNPKTSKRVKSSTKVDTRPPSEIQQLMSSPALFEPVRKPRNPIVLCHGLYGFDVIGPASFQRQYWSEVLEILRDKIKADVIVTSVPATGSIQDRAKVLNEKLRERAKGKEVNLFGHSMGGLDCRQLITHIRPKEYTPLSLTTIATPHRGSPFMDWCSHNIGIGALQDVVKSAQRPNIPYSLSSPLLTRSTHSSTSSQASTKGPDVSPALSTLSPFLTYLGTLPQSITTLILSYVDSPAYANLTTSYLNDVFNPATPNVEGVKYFSVAGRVDSMSIFHPLWLPKLILDKSEEVEQESLNSSSSRSLSDGRDGDKWPTSQIGRYPPHHELGNDGLVPISSAQWGEFLGIVEGADHWDIRGASGFSAQYELAGAAGGLGWVSGVDWTKWGIPIPWIGGGSKTTDSNVAEKAAETGSAAEKVKAAIDTAKDIAVYKQKAGSDSDEDVSGMMTWIGEHMAKATSDRKAEDILTSKVSKPQEELIELRTPQPPKPMEEGKFDLERLYMALTRKLYDEGL